MTDLATQLTRAENFFCSAKDGEDRESMAAFWVSVARAAVVGPDRLAALLDAYDELRATDHYECDDTRYDAALAKLAEF